jgi:nucleoside-diphosphate-sugar epimerase
MMRVLVTGATGFVGRHVCPAIIGAGHEVSAAVRRPDHPNISPGASYHVVPDIGPETEWGKALSGIDAVVHLAARVHIINEDLPDPLFEYCRVNTDGTASLAKAAAGAGVRRFVFLSTVKVMGERTTARPFVETDTPKPEDAYGLSKWAAEKALMEAAGQGRLEPVILRPPLIYGPGVGGNFLSLLELCQKASPLPLMTVNNLRSFLYVGNLVDAILRCLRPDNKAARQTYFVRDGEDLSTPALIRHVARALGRPALLFPAPKSLIRLAGLMTGKSKAVRRVVDSLQIDDEKIRRQLGWKPPWDVVQGLKETAVWFTSGKRV